MTLHEVATLVSIWASPVQMGFNLLVIYFSAPSAKKAIYNLIHGKRASPVGLLALGIAVGEVQRLLDTGYWINPWSAEFIDPLAPITEVLFSLGVYFNIPFRQGLGIASSIFHVLGFLAIGARFKAIKNTFYAGAAVGSLTVIGLIMARAYL